MQELVNLEPKYNSSNSYVAELVTLSGVQPFFFYFLGGVILSKRKGRVPQISEFSIRWSFSTDNKKIFDNKIPRFQKLFIEAALRKFHRKFLAKHIKNISLTVPAKALVDYATCLRRILFLLYLLEKLWSSDG